MKTLKNKLLVSFISMLVLCLTLAFAFSFNATKVQATVDNDAFVMVEGASVATNKDGIRFRVQMGQNVYDKVFTNDANDDVKLSVLIAPETFYDDLAETANAGKYQQLAKKVEVKIDDVAKVYKQGDYYFANAVLTNLAVANNNAITADQFDLEFVAVGCIATTTGSETTYEYTALSEARTQYQVAQSAILDVEDITGEYAKVLLAENSPYKTWLGKEEHPVVVDSEEDFTSLTTKVVNEVSFDNVAIDIKNDFGIADRTSIPASATITHKVNFYNGSELVESKWVADGTQAVAPTVDEIKSMVGSHSVASKEIGTLMVEKFSGWVDGEKATVSLDAIANFTNVYANYVSQDARNEVFAELKEEQPNNAFFFDHEIGATTLSQDGANEKFVTSFDTTFKVPGQKGSTKIQMTNNGGGAAFWIYYTPADIAHLSDDCYVVMDVYFAGPAEVTQLWLKTNYTNASAINNNSWGKYVVSASVLKTGTPYFQFDMRGGAAGTVATVWFGQATVVKKTDFVELNNESTITLGDVQVTGLERYREYVGDSGQNGTANAAVFNEDYMRKIISYNNELYYLDHNPDVSDRSMYMHFPTALTGKVYFVAIGFDTGKTNAQMFTTSELSSHVGTPDAVYEGQIGCYGVYSFNFGSNQISMIRLRTYGYMNQLWIKGIYTTNPLQA